MTLNQKKIDVTDRITGKIRNGEIELFLENTSIGKVQLPENANYQLEHHFEQEQQKIYQHITTSDQPNAKYTDCDDSGWC